MNRRDEIDAELHALDEEALAQDAFAQDVQTRPRRATKVRTSLPETDSEDEDDDTQPVAATAVRAAVPHLVLPEPLNNAKPTSSSSGRSRSASPTTRGRKKGHGGTDDGAGGSTKPTLAAPNTSATHTRSWSTSPNSSDERRSGRWSKEPTGDGEKTPHQLGAGASANAGRWSKGVSRPASPNPTSKGKDSVENAKLQTLEEALTPGAHASAAPGQIQTLFEALAPQSTTLEEALSPRSFVLSSEQVRDNVPDSVGKTMSSSSPLPQSEVVTRTAVERADRAAKLRLELSEIEVQLPKLQKVRCFFDVFGFLRWLSKTCACSTYTRRPHKTIFRSSGHWARASFGMLGPATSSPDTHTHTRTGVSALFLFSRSSVLCGTIVGTGSLVATFSSPCASATPYFTQHLNCGPA